MKSIHVISWILSISSSVINHLKMVSKHLFTFITINYKALVRTGRVSASVFRTRSFWVAFFHLQWSIYRCQCLSALSSSVISWELPKGSGPLLAFLTVDCNGEVTSLCPAAPPWLPAVVSPMVKWRQQYLTLGQWWELREFTYACSTFSWSSVQFTASA